MSKKNKNKKSKFGLFAALAAIAGVGIYFFTKDSEKASAPAASSAPGTEAAETAEEETAKVEAAEEAEAKTVADIAIEAAEAAKAAEAATDTNTKVVAIQNSIELAKEALAAAEEAKQSARWYLFPESRYDLDTITQDEVNEIFKNVNLLTAYSTVPDKRHSMTTKLYDKNTKEIFTIRGFGDIDTSKASEYVGYDYNFFKRLRNKAKEIEYDTLTDSYEREYQPNPWSTEKATEVITYYYDAITNLIL